MEPKMFGAVFHGREADQERQKRYVDSAQCVLFMVRQLRSTPLYGTSTPLLLNNVKYIRKTSKVYV